MIEPIRHIGDIYISKEGERIDLEKIPVSRKTLQRYESAMNPDVPLRYRFKQFLRAENDLGKAAKVVKHGLIIFTPFGPAINTLDDLIKNILIPNKRTIMTDESKPLPQSRTVIVFGLLFVVGLLQLFGIDLGLELSPDAQWVSAAAGFAGIILRLVTGRPVKLSLK